MTSNVRVGSPGFRSEHTTVRWRCTPSFQRGCLVLKFDPRAGRAEEISGS